METANDVWSTISQFSKDYFGFKTASANAAASATAASPGKPAANGANPFPGTQGPYPQAEAKPAPGGTGISAALGNVGTWIIVGVVLLIGLALARR